MRTYGVIGSRTWDNEAVVFSILDGGYAKGKIAKIVSGGAKGADTIAEKWAKTRKIPCEVFHIRAEDVKTKGQRGAPHVRNQRIVDACDILLAFWDGESAGTQSTIKKAFKAGKPVFAVYPDGLTRRLRENGGE